MYHLYQRTPTSWELDIYDNDFDTAYVHFAGTVRKWIEDNKETFDDMVKYTIIHSEYIFDPNSVKKNQGREVAIFSQESEKGTRYSIDFASEKDAARFKLRFGNPRWTDSLD